MSVVIIGGNERMEHTYKEICNRYGCSVKVYTKDSGAFKRKIGKPDLLICFSNTVSHKMVNVAKKEAHRLGFPIEHCKSSSSSALEKTLKTLGVYEVQA